MVAYDKNNRKTNRRWGNSYENQKIFLIKKYLPFYPIAYFKYLKQ